MRAYLRASRATKRVFSGPGVLLRHSQPLAMEPVINVSPIDVEALLESLARGERGHFRQSGLQHSFQLIDELRAQTGRKTFRIHPFASRGSCWRGQCIEL